MHTPGIFQRFLIWRTRHIKTRQFLLLLSFIIGIISGLAAVILKTTLHYMAIWLDRGHISVVYLVFPFFGIILTWLFVRYIVKDQIGHGVSRILFAISKKASKLKPHNDYSSMVASTLTIGFGGSVGSEAPIVLTGASLGSTLGRILRLNYKQRTLLLGCGAAGAIAGIFKAPIAGVAFTLEVLMLDLTLSSIVPLLIASVTGAMVSYFMMGNGVLFNFVLKEGFNLKDFPYFILLGVFTGLISLYFTKMNMYIESVFDSIKKSWLRILSGGLILSLLIYLFPSLYGEGYGTISSLLEGNSIQIAEKSFFLSHFQLQSWFLLYLGIVVFVKVIAMAVTNGAGGVGGIFAPSLFTGGVAGYFFAGVLNSFPGVQISERNFALVGMAGLMAGVMHAPLTGIFLIAEITGGYGLLIPLIIAATISFLTIMYFEPYSIYTKRLAKRGELITHDKDQAVLTLMDWKREIEKDHKAVHPEESLGALVKIVAHSKRNIFPVVDDKKNILGIVSLDQIREIMFRHEMYETTYVRDLMVLPQAIISPEDTMETVLNKFKRTGAWNLPVAEKGRYIGFLSKSRIFAAYRKVLVEVS